MKHSLLTKVLASLAFASAALANPFLLVDGTPHPSNNSTFVNMVNDAPSDYAKGTDFQSTPVAGGVVTHRLKLRNIGSSLLSYSVTENSPHFRAIGSGSVLVATTGERIFDIEFNPTSEGLKTTTLFINSNDPNRPSFEVNLRGFGTAPEADILGGSILNIPISDGDTSPSFTDRTDFGSRDIFSGGDSRFFRLLNSGSGDLQFISANVTSGQGFSITSLPSNASFLDPSEGHNFILTFNPSTIGQKTATVSILTNDSNEGLYTFSVTGEGTVTPDIVLKGRSGNLPLSAIPIHSTVHLLTNGTEFPNTEINSSTSNLYQVSNEGTTTLDYQVSLDNSSAFSLSGNFENSAGIGAANTNSYSISFNPTTPGIHSTQVTITSNDPDEDPYTYEVQGFATAPEITVLGDTDFSEEIENRDYSPRVGDGTNFLDVEVDGPSETRTFRIKNDGTSTLTFLEADIDNSQGFNISHPAANSPIPPFGHLEFTVFFNPYTDGQVTARVNIVTTDSDETPYTFDVTGNGIGDPEAQIFGDYSSLSNLGDFIAPGTLQTSFALGTKFSDTELGNSTSHIFAIRNAGNGTLNYTASDPGPHFRIEGLGSTLEPNLGSNSDESFAIIFEPTSRGTKSQLITFTSNDPATPSYVFAIEGTAVGSELDIFGGITIQNDLIKDGQISTSIAEGTDFGTLNVGAPGTTHTFLLRNDGEEDLIIANPDFTLSDDTHFTVTGLPNPLDPILPNTNRTFQITFEPQSSGQKTVVFSLVSNDFNENPYTFQITGLGINGPEINLLGGSGNIDIPDGHGSPSTSDGTNLGTADVGESVSGTFIIENNGNQPLSLSQPTTSGDFSAALDGSATVSAGSSTTLTVTFTPTSAGVRTAFITLSNNDADESPYTFAVRAEGIQNQTNAPPFSTFTISGSSGTFKFISLTGVSYQLRSSTDLVQWHDLGTPIEGTGLEITTTIDNFNIAATPTQFFRLEIVQPE